jgi:hypothetical protein
MVRGSALRIGRTVRSTSENSSRSTVLRYYDPTHFATHNFHQRDSRCASLIKIHVCCVKKHGRSVLNRHRRRHRHRLHNSILQQPCYASLSCRMQPVMIQNNAARQCC